MSTYTPLIEVEKNLNRILTYALDAGCDLPCVTLRKKDFEIFEKFNLADHRGEFYFKNVLIKKGH